MDFATVDYTPVAVAPWTPVAILAVLVAFVVLTVFLDRRKATRKANPAFRSRRIARMTERNLLDKLSAAHMLRS